ncbi:MAG: hypothetical protein LAP21_09485 [Acidobacteriia bacterium]|nr:hypothetical protein [Terriglobia bacterium]
MNSEKMKSLSRFCVLLVLVAAGLIANAAQKLSAGGGAAVAAGGALGGLYRGTLASQSIVLEVSQAGTNVEGRYFYSRIGKAIGLKGTRLPDGSFRLREIQGKKASGAEWRLTASGAQASGFFCKCDVRLPAAPGAKLRQKISMERAAQGVTYNDLLLDFPLQEGPEQRVNDEIAWAMQTDTRFKAEMPHLIRFPDKAVMAKVNADLAARLKSSRQSSAEQFQSVDGEGSGDEDSGGEGSDFSQSVHVGLVSREIFSMSTTDYWYSAGTPHPNITTEVLIYNLLAGGEPFDFQDFFRESEQIEVDKSTENKEDDARLPLDNLDRELVKRYLKHYGKTPAECNEDDKEEIMRASPTMFFDKDGLSVEYELSYARRDCGESVIIPYYELGPLVRNDSRLHYLVEGRAVSK